MPIEIRKADVGHLLAEADHYRQLARGAIPWHLAERFERWADQAQRQAVHLSRISGRVTL